MPTEEEIEESRRRLGIPDDWEWFPCSNDCGDLVWIPPGFGDMRIEPVCSNDCAQEFVFKAMRGDA